jgi:hypothetical protein
MAETASGKGFRSSELGVEEDDDRDGDGVVGV